MIKYLKDSLYELTSNVIWTKRKEAQRLLVVVLTFTVLFSLSVWLVDTLLSGAILRFFGILN